MDGVVSTMSYVLFNTRVLKMSMVLCSNLHLVACGFVLVLWCHLFLSGEDQTGKAGMGRDINSSIYLGGGEELTSKGLPVCVPND